MAFTFLMSFSLHSLDEKIFCQKTPANLIYFALESDTIGKYNTTNNETNLQKSTVCSEDKKIASFHFKGEEDLLLTVCSNSSLSEIIVSKFESITSIQRIQKNYTIVHMIVSKNEHLVFVVFNGNNFSVIKTSLNSSK